MTSRRPTSKRRRRIVAAGTRGTSGTSGTSEWQGGGAGATLGSCCPTVGPGACAVALFWSELELDAIKGSEL